MFTDLLLLMIGVILLVKGSDELVDSVTRIALRIGISITIISLSIIATGTSLPELVVSVTSSASGYSGLALGNIIGANIANICLIIGVCSMIKRMDVEPSVLNRDIPMTVLVILLLFVLSLDNKLDRMDGSILLLSAILYFYYLFMRARHEKKITSEDPEEPDKKDILKLCIGVLMVLAGGELTVHASINIATDLNISPYLVGLLLVAVGTSLPELTTGIISTLKGYGENIPRQQPRKR